MMSRKQQEHRLDDVLSRIAMETQEIRDLEQQLTEGQILVNESLQHDLQEVISGLQEYLGGVRREARQAREKAQNLEEQNQDLQRHLEAALLHCSHLVHTHTLRQSSLQQYIQNLEAMLDQARADILDHNGAAILDACDLVEVLLTGQNLSPGSQNPLSRLQQLVQRIQGPDRSREPDKTQRPNPRREPDYTQGPDRSRRVEQRAQHVARGPSRRRYRELQQLKRLKSEQLIVEQLNSATEQLRALHHLVECWEQTYGRKRPIRTCRDHEAPGHYDSGLELQYLSSPTRGPPGSSCSSPGGAGAVPPPRGPAPPAGGPVEQCGVAEHRELTDRLEVEERKTEERKKHRLEMKRLRQTLRTNSCVCVCAEVQCVEQTLLKRRTELREANRRALHTHSKVRSVQQKLASSRMELQQLQGRVQDSTTCLMEAKQQLWEVRRRREEEQRNLEEVKRRHQEIQRFNRLQQEVWALSLVDAPSGGGRRQTTSRQGDKERRRLGHFL